MKPNEEVLAEAERLCRAVCPDLEGMPFYILDAGELPWTLHRRCGGFAARDLDVAIKKYLGPRWRGRGPAIVVDTRFRAEGFDDNSARQTTFEICLHELAHHFAEGWVAMIDRDHGQEAIPVFAGELFDEEDLAAVGIDVDRDLVPEAKRASGGKEPRQDRFREAAEWRAGSRQHGSAFYRVASHMVLRAWDLAAAGWAEWNVSPDGVFLGHEMAICRTTLVKWLTAEHRRFRGLPLAAILEQPMDADYLSLFSTHYRQVEQACCQLEQRSLNMSRSVLQKTLDGLTRIRSKTATTYKELVASTANGKETKPEAVADILFRAGKSAEDLARDVDLQLRRRQLAAAVSRGGEPAEAELVQVQASIAKADAELQAAVDALYQKHAKLVDPLLTRVAELRRFINDAVSARCELESTAEPETAQRYQELQAQANAIEAELRIVQAQIAAWEASDLDRRQRDAEGLIKPDAEPSTLTKTQEEQAADIRARRAAAIGGPKTDETLEANKAKAEQLAQQLALIRGHQEQARAQLTAV